jgi:hypothetical protein
MPPGPRGPSHGGDGPLGHATTGARQPRVRGDGSARTTLSAQFHAKGSMGFPIVSLTLPKKHRRPGRDPASGDFSSGPNGEEDGLFGSLRPVTAGRTPAAPAGKPPGPLLVDCRGPAYSNTGRPGAVIRRVRFADRSP